MAQLSFQDFRELISDIAKEDLFDAVKPTVQTYSANKFGEKSDPSYQKILDLAFRGAGGAESTPQHGAYDIIRRMGKGLDGEGSTYTTSRIHAERLYYAFLFSEECDDPAYGEMISQKLFQKSFFRRFERELHRKGIRFPDWLPPAEQAFLGPVTVSLGIGAGIEALTIDELDRNRLIIDDRPDVYEAIHWKSRLSGLYGRSDEYGRLLDWALDEGALEAKVMLVRGPGGVGKTRLVAEVVSKLKHELGWSAGFLPAGNLENLPVFDGSGNGVAIVIDYPEERTEQVVQILKAAAKPIVYDRPVRIILVSRENRERWSKALNEPRLVRFNEIILEAKPYLEATDAIAVADDVLATYPELIDREKEKFEGVQAWLDQDHVHRLPLNVVAAAVHAVLDPDHAFELSSRDVLITLAEIELKRVQFYSQRDLGSTEALKRLLGLAVFTPSGIFQQTLHCLGEIGICEGKNGDNLLDAIKKTPFWRGGNNTIPPHLHRIVPDKAAAAFFIISFEIENQEPPLSFPTWLATVASQSGKGFAEVLGRLVYDISLINDILGRTIEEFAVKMIDASSKNIDIFREIIEREYPIFSTKFASELCSRLLSSTQEPKQVSKLLHVNSIYLSNLDKHKEAFAAIQKAVRIRRSLDASSSDGFKYELSDSLIQLAAKLSRFGDSKSAIDTIQEALRNLRCLSSANDKFLPQITAKCLMEYAIILHNVNKNDAALNIIDESIKIYRSLVQEDRSIHLAGLAHALNRRSIVLSELELHDVALNSATEATKLMRELALSRPELFTSELAISLGAQSNMLSSVGKHTEAIPVAEEAVKVCRELVRTEQTYFRRSLSTCLHALAGICAELDCHDMAFAYIEEAIENYRIIIRAGDAASLASCARALVLRSNLLEGLGRNDEQLSSLEEAVSVFRALANLDPDAYQRFLALALDKQSAALIVAGQEDNALLKMKEAASVYRTLADRQSDIYLPILAKKLSNNSLIVYRLGSVSESLPLIEEAVRHYRVLAEGDPGTFLSRLAESLDTKASILATLEEHLTARASIDEAVNIFRELAAAQPETFLQGLARSLNNRSTMYSTLRMWDESLASIEEANEIYRKLSESSPDTFLEHFATSLNNYSNELYYRGRNKKSLELIQRSVEIRRDLAAGRPDDFNLALAGSLSNQALTLFQLGRQDEAKASIEEAVDLLRSEYIKFRPTYLESNCGIIESYLQILAQTGGISSIQKIKPILVSFKNNSPKKISQYDCANSTFFEQV